jgi:hypothetical protein
MKACGFILNLRTGCPRRPSPLWHPFHAPCSWPAACSSEQASRPAFQAYQILHGGFIVAPLLAGLDKFTHFLTDWDQYLAPVVAGLLPVSGRSCCWSGSLR